ncbi:MAG: UDP-N-acetylmuramoyl-L-alanine--D-glutamate ligase [Geminicoccaceae bacterium]
MAGGQADPDVIALTAWRGQRVAVFGLARSGLSTLHALRRGGAETLAIDDQPAARERAAALGFVVASSADADLTGAAMLVVAPGIPLNHRLLDGARRSGLPIQGDVDLFAQEFPDACVVGITGTNGKSTTTALLGGLLNNAGKTAKIGGNIGVPVLDLGYPKKAYAYILELSSFQLDLTAHLHCRCAVWTNLSPDHLDRHGSFMAYQLAKERIFCNQVNGDWAVIGVDDCHGQDLLARLSKAAPQRRLVPISGQRALPHGVFVDNHILYDAIDSEPHAVADLRHAPALIGAHNAQNAACAYAAGRALCVESAALADGLARFPGLPHRIEHVGTLSGIRIFNDSKATNVAAAATSLGCFDTIYWIAGGRPKPGGLGDLAPFLPRIRHTFLIGEAQDRFAEELRPAVSARRCGDLETALDSALSLARQEAVPGAVILLAPACASFDQFRDFEARGDAFRELVQARMAERA